MVLLISNSNCTRPCVVAEHCLTPSDVVGKESGASRPRGVKLNGGRGPPVLQAELVLDVRRKKLRRDTGILGWGPLTAPCSESSPRSVRGEPTRLRTSRCGL